MASEQEMFEYTVAEAQEIEKKALAHTEYGGSFEIRRVIDFSPEEYSEMSFEDLINQYNRIEKIIKTSQLGIYSTEKMGAGVRARSSEFEVKIKEMSKESLHKVEELGREFEKEPVIKRPEEITSLLEFEKGWGEEEARPREEPQKAVLPKKGRFEEEFEIPKEEKHALEGGEEGFVTEELRMEEKKERKEEKKERIEDRFKFEKSFEMETKVEARPPKEEKVKERIPSVSETVAAPPVRQHVPPAVMPPVRGEKKELKPLERALARVRERKGAKTEELAPQIGIPSVPQVLAPARTEEPTTVFEKIQRTFDYEWGDERDEAKIKRKMLELTKELFREKSTARREEIKRQIVVLKNLLAHVTEAPPKSKKKESSADYSTGLFATLVSTMSSEFSSTLESMGSAAEKQIAAAKENFQSSRLEISDSDSSSKKLAFDKFVFALTGINEQLAAEAAKFKDAIVKKHVSTVEQFEASLDEGGEVNRKKAVQKKKEIRENYERDVSVLLSNVSGKISALIETTSHGVLTQAKGPESRPQLAKTIKKEEKMLNVAEIISEINSLDEGSLLYYLHSNDFNRYREFEHGNISRHKALAIARRLMAKEKGLSEAIVDKYWSGM